MKINGTLNLSRNSKRVSKLTTLQEHRALWFLALFECHERRHGWKSFGIDPFMDLWTEVRWEELPESIEWFVYCMKMIDHWLDKTYLGNKNRPIWSGEKWVNGVKNWLFKNRFASPKDVKGSSLYVDAKGLEKASFDAEKNQGSSTTQEMIEAVEKAQKLFNEAPTPERKLWLTICRDRTYEQRMEEVRILIRAGEITKTFLEAISADTGLSDFVEFILLSGLADKMIKGNYV